MNVNIDIKELFAAGAHFGHRTYRWHPKMSQYIHSEKNGIHIINLEETVKKIEEALKVVADNASRSRQILFVSTKQQAEEPIKKVAQETDQPYVVGRWMGGLLTNSKTIKGRIKHLKELEKRMDSGELKQRYSKLEVQRYQEEIDILNEQFGGIKEMPGMPGLIFIVDINKDKIAVKEAKKLGIPTVGLVDSNSDPSKLDYPIPANDDAIKTIDLILGYIQQAINEGKSSVKVVNKQLDDKTETKTENKPVEEKEVKENEKPSKTKKESKVKKEK